MEIEAVYFIPVVAITILFLISRFGKEREWYKRRGNWFSRVMHFCAGFFVAIFWSGFTGSVLGIIGLTFAVGVLWEVAEYVAGLIAKRFGRYDMMPKRGDTIEDLIMDVTGAVISVLILML